MLGEAIAAALAKERMQVVIADLDQHRLAETAQRLQEHGSAVHTKPLDVSDWDEWRRAIDGIEDDLGPITVLVNNAAVGGGGPVALSDPMFWRRSLEVNALGAFFGCRAVLPRWLARDAPAHIVNVASLQGLRADPSLSAYCASKHALVGLSDSLRTELRATRIGISVAYPGRIRTDFVANSNAIAADYLGAGHVAFAPELDTVLESGMRPEFVARRILAGMLAGEYHIFTHGDWRDLLHGHFQDRLGAIGANADPDFQEDPAALMRLMLDQ